MVALHFRQICVVSLEVAVFVRDFKVNFTELEPWKLL